jgi:membrane protease YdiL (CAAX protease family)
MKFESSHPPFCVRHPTRRARAACVRCGDYLCEECLSESESGALCPRCGGVERPGGENAPCIAWDTGDTGDDLAQPTAPRSPASAAARGGCAFHPGEHAAALCSNCGTPVCTDCRRVARGEALCPDCFAFMAEKRARPAPAAVPSVPGSGVGTASYPEARWKLWPGLAFLPFPFLLELLTTYMINQGGEVSLGAAVFFLSAILYATLLIFAAWQVGGQSGWLKKLGVTGRNLKAGLSWGLLGGLATFGFTAIFLTLSVHLLQNWGWIESWLKGLREINVKAGVGQVDLIVAFVVVVLIGPICEEAFFRGYLYPPMRRELGVVAAVVLNATLFSLVHLSLFGLLSRMVAGCIFCALYEHTDNLAAPVTAHMLNNLVAFILPVVSM